MKSVKISITGTTRSYDLNAVQIKQFKMELKRTAPWRTCRGLIAYLLGRDRYTMPKLAPDATIAVFKNNGSQTGYKIYGRAVLQNDRSRRNRQFYMSALMLEWANY